MAWDSIFGSLIDSGVADWSDDAFSLASNNTDWLYEPITSAASTALDTTTSGFDWSSLVNSLGGTAGKTALSLGSGLLGNYLSSNAQGNQSQAYADYLTKLSEAQQKQSEQAQENYNKWLRLLKPTEEQKESYRASGTKRIWGDFNSSNRTLSNNLASRGIGGGQLATGLADNKRQLFSKLGDLEADVEKYGAGTYPSSPAPTTTTATTYPSLSTTDYFTSNLGNLLQYGSGTGLTNALTSSTGSNSDLDTWVKNYFGWA